MKPLFAALFCASLLNTLPAYAKPLNGIILGVDAGVIQMESTAKQRTHSVAPGSFDLIFTNGDNNKLSDLSSNIGLIAGFAYSLNDCWLLGIEGRGNISSINMELNTTLINTQSGSYATIPSDVSLPVSYTHLTLPTILRV